MLLTEVAKGFYHLNMIRETIAERKKFESSSFESLFAVVNNVMLGESSNEIVSS